MTALKLKYASKIRKKSHKALGFHHTRERFTLLLRAQIRGGK